MICLSWFVFFGSIVFLSLTAFAQQERRGRRWSTPLDVLKKVGEKTDEKYRIQETALNDVTDSGRYPRHNKITNTLDNLRENLSPYLNRTVYLGSAIGVILIIYNGILLVSSSITGTDIKKAMENIKNVIIGVAILRWFWFLIKLAMIIINTLAGK